MIRRESAKPEVERRAGASDPAKARSKALTPEQETALLAVTGLTRAALYNRRGGLSERGLAALLEPGDQVADILADRVVILAKDGTRQTYWNLDKELPFLTSAPASSVEVPARPRAPAAGEPPPEGSDEGEPDVSWCGDPEGGAP